MVYIQKRLQTELKKFIIPHLLYSDHEIYQDNSYNCKYAINLIIYLKNNDILLFKLGQYYPFKPPELLVNKKNYRDFFLKLDKDVISFLEKECSLKCICCDSVLCENNWSPNLNIVSIINEYIKRKNTVKKYYLKGLIQLIIDKNNIHEYGITRHITDFILI